MCGGRYDEFTTPKQLLKVNGEVIIERTIRLLKENGIKDIAISTTNPAFDYLEVPKLKHNNTFIHEYKNEKAKGWWLDAFYPTNEPTCYIWGDVYFSEAAIKTIVETETDDIELFGSMPPFADNYVKRWIEPFALKVFNTNHLKESIEKTKDHSTFYHLLYHEGGDIIGVCVHTEASVKTEFLGQFVRDTGAATAANHLVAQALGLHQLDEVGHVVDVDILLGHGLRHQQGIGVEFDALGDELLVGHLRAEVVGLNHLVALQSVVAGIALHVHDGIDTHGVGVGTRRGADDDDLTSDVLLDVFVGLIHVHRGRFHLGHIDG